MRIGGTYPVFPQYLPAMWTSIGNYDESDLPRAHDAGHVRDFPRSRHQRGDPGWFVSFCLVTRKPSTSPLQSSTRYLLLCHGTSFRRYPATGHVSDCIFNAVAHDAMYAAHVRGSSFPRSGVELLYILRLSFVNPSLILLFMTPPVVANASCGGGVRLSAPVAESVIPAPVKTYAASAPVIEYIAGRARRTSTRSYLRAPAPVVDYAVQQSPTRRLLLRSCTSHPAVLDVRGTSLSIFFEACTGISCFSGLPPCLETGGALCSAFPCF